MPSAPYKTVAVLGGTGDLGERIVSALLASPTPFVVSVTSRFSTSEIPPNAKLIHVEDYTNVPVLTAQLQGQDCVISALCLSALPVLENIIDACVAAGVKRFVSGEFGNTRDQVGIPELSDARKAKWGTSEYAAKMAEEDAQRDGCFTWCAVATGVFVDFALKKFPTAMGFNPAKSLATLYDGGSEPFTGTTLRGIGDACVGLCMHPDETKNRVLRVRSVYTTQLEMLVAFETATGGETWKVEQVRARDIIERGRKKRLAGDRTATLDLVSGQLFEGGAGRSVVCKPGEGDNELLGVKEEPLVQLVKRVLSDDI